VAVVVGDDDLAQARSAADARVERAERLVRVGRLNQAVIEYRRAISLLQRVSEPEAASLRERVRKLSRSFAVVRFDLSALPKDGYVELAVDGRVVPAAALRPGLLVLGGAVQVAASRPGCRDWTASLDVASGTTKTVVVPALRCDQTSVVTGFETVKTRRAPLRGSAFVAGARVPTFLLAQPSGRVGSRNGLLIWGSVFGAAGAGALVWGFANDDDRRDAIDFRPFMAKALGTSLAVGSVVCLTIYATSRGDEEGDRVVVAPLVDGDSGTGVAVSWSGRW